MADRLRELWDFDDLDATEERLREQLRRETDGPGQAEVLTQLARLEGLRGDFEEGVCLLEDAWGRAGESRTVWARIDLELGRLRRSSGDEEAALPLFESAYALAVGAEEPFHAADAAHMAALVARGGFEAWTARGIALAETHEEARHWLGPLLNNLGWHHYERGEYGPALDAFERALAAREASPQDPEAIEIARYAVGKALRALGRSEEAVPLLEQAVAWASGRGKPDGWFHEELAEDYAALGRDDDAREQARLALPLLLETDPSFTGDEDRAERLRAIAGS